MSKGKKIESFIDLLDRPLYKNIIELLKENNAEMSAKEIRERLSFSKKAQTFNTYLNYLIKFGLIKHALAKDKRRVVYRSLNEEEDHLMHREAGVQSIIEKLKAGNRSYTFDDNKTTLLGFDDYLALDKQDTSTPPEIRKSFLKQKVQTADAIEDAIVKNPTMPSLEYGLVEFPPKEISGQKIPVKLPVNHIIYSSRIFIGQKLKSVLHEQINDFLKTTGQEPATIKVIYKNWKKEKKEIEII